MFKQIDQSDSYIRKITTYANHSLTNASDGVQALTGISGSSNFVSSSNWNWTNGLFYNIGYPKLTAHQSSYNQTKNLDTTCRILAIPIKDIGKRIFPGSFSIEETSASITFTFNDDGNGNIYDTSSGSSYVKGNIFYDHGIIIMTDTGSIEQRLGTSSVISFKSTHNIYEHNYICRIEAGEGNFSTNPSAVYGISGSTSTLAKDQVRFDPFRAYITTIGLYNDYNELIAVGKLASPIINDTEQALSFHIQLDI